MTRARNYPIINGWTLFYLILGCLFWFAVIAALVNYWEWVVLAAAVVLIGWIATAWWFRSAVRQTRR